MIVSKIRMPASAVRRVAGLALVMIAPLACSLSGAGRSVPLTPAQQAAADGGIQPYTEADVRFMQGMIGHHAQAVEMAAWAPSRARSEGVKVLAARIDVAQRDEIAFIRRWLGARDKLPADVHSPHAAHGALMPGMLTAAEMTQLEASRGEAFDRHFMTFMIKHHDGALVMVDELFASPGAGQDNDIFRFAADVEADQMAEIDRMLVMLERLDAAGGTARNDTTPQDAR